MAKDVTRWISDQDDPVEEEFTPREGEMLDTMLEVAAQLQEAHKRLSEAWVKQKDLELDNANLRREGK